MFYRYLSWQYYLEIKLLVYLYTFITRSYSLNEDKIYVLGPGTLFWTFFETTITEKPRLNSKSPSDDSSTYSKRVHLKWGTLEDKPMTTLTTCQGKNLLPIEL